MYCNTMIAFRLPHMLTPSRHRVEDSFGQVMRKWEGNVASEAGSVMNALVCDASMLPTVL